MEASSARTVPGNWGYKPTHFDTHWGLALFLPSQSRDRVAGASRKPFAAKDLA